MTIDTTIIQQLSVADRISQFRLSDVTVHYFHPTIPLPGFPDRAVFDLTSLVNSISWSDDLDSAALTAKIRFNYHEKLKDIVGDGGIFTIFGYLLQESGGITFGEICRVVVITTDVDTDEFGTAVFIVTGMDHMFFAANNEHTAKFPAGMKASDIISSLCVEFNIPMGTIADTGAALGRLIFRKESIYDMMITALSESRYMDGQRYILRMEQGRLNLYQQSNPKQIFILSYGDNIYNASLHKSISKLKTRVKIYGTQTSDDLGALADSVYGVLEDNDTQILYATEDDSFMMQYYGLLQKIETGVSPDRITDIQAYARHLLSTVNKVEWIGSVSAPSINNLRWGDPVYIYEPITGMVGQFYIESSSHTIDESGARMQLQVHYEARLPEILFEKFEKDFESRSLLDEIADNNNLHPQPDEYVPPLTEYVIIQEFGANPHTTYNPSASGHSGIDMAKQFGGGEGQNIHAVNDGTVEFASVDPSQLGGNMVIIDHEDGYRTLYAHLQVIYVKVGRVLTRGEVIGLVGHTGSADPAVNPGGGPHLHFQVMQGNKIIDPRRLIPGIHT